jgi:hypothetical protein
VHHIRPLCKWRGLTGGISLNRRVVIEQRRVRVLPLHRSEYVRFRCANLCFKPGEVRVPAAEYEEPVVVRVGLILACSWWREFVCEGEEFVCKGVNERVYRYERVRRGLAPFR